MYCKIFVKIILVSSISVLIASCGTDSSVGGVTEFKTSYATASASTTRLEADLITGNTCSVTGSTGGTIETESVDITIKATSSTKGSVASLPIEIMGWTVTFVPKNAGIPELPPLSATTSTYITPSSSVSIPVAITTDLQKLNLIIANPSLPCSLNLYQYDVYVRFTAREVGSTEGSKLINASLVMALADRNN
jgi:hypothetical protein